MSIRFGILTVSDSSFQGQRADASGPELVRQVETLGWQVVRTDIVPDEFEVLTKILIEWCGSGALDVILTTGGTGFSPRDVTPEATQAVIERPAPGLVEAMRQESLKITAHAMLSRAAAGIRGQTLVVNLPGSPKAARENLDVLVPVLPHAVQLLQDDPDSEASHRIGTT